MVGRVGVTTDEVTTDEVTSPSLTETEVMAWGLRPHSLTVVVRSTPRMSPAPRSMMLQACQGQPFHDSDEGRHDSDEGRLVWETLTPPCIPAGLVWERWQSLHVTPSNQST